MKIVWNSYAKNTHGRDAFTVDPITQKFSLYISFYVRERETLHENFSLSQMIFQK